MILEKNKIDSPILAMNEQSRIWIYQSHRLLTDKEEVVLKSQLNAFVRDWTAHNSPLAASSDVLFQRFILLAVDESQVGASGCSIDKSVHFLQDIENQYNISLFDRMNFAFWQDDAIKTASSTDFKRLNTEGVLNEETLVFDNMINSVLSLKNAWIKPLKESWHKRFV